MDKDQMLKRLHHIELELDELKTETDPARGVWTFVRPVQRLGNSITHHWVLFSVLAALITAGIAKYNFGIDYLEDYRNIATTKEISTFYREVGDRMMANSEWKAAEDAYRTSLEVNPNNRDAAYGLVKAQVFQPLEGEKFFAPGVVEAKLESLLEDFPEDHQVLFLKGTAYMLLEDYGEAREWLEKAIRQNPEFIGSYLQMGIIEQQSFNLDKAINFFETARLKDSNDDAIANNNLGFLYLLKLEYEKSIWHLRQAYSLSPSVLTLINLGDAYLFMGDYRSALQFHIIALDALNQPDVESERYVAGTWYYNSMPLKQEEEEPLQYLVRVGTLLQKQAIVHYRLSFDYALKGDFESADQEFQNAQNLDPSHQYNNFFIFHIQSIINLLELEGDTKNWFETQWNDLYLQLQ